MAASNTNDGGLCAGGSGSNEDEWSLSRAHKYDRILANMVDVGEQLHWQESRGRQTDPKLLAKCDSLFDMAYKNPWMLAERRRAPSDIERQATEASMRSSAETGDDATLTHLLDARHLNRANVNCGALRLAVENGHLRCIQLLAQEMDLDAVTEGPWLLTETPSAHMKRLAAEAEVRSAAEAGDDAMLAQLLESRHTHRANVNCGALIPAISNGHLRCVELLMQEKDIEINYDERDGRHSFEFTPLHAAVCCEKESAIDIVRLLFDVGATICGGSSDNSQYPPDVHRVVIRYRDENGQLLPDLYEDNLPIIETLSPEQVMCAQERSCSAVSLALQFASSTELIKLVLNCCGAELLGRLFTCHHISYWRPRYSLDFEYLSPAQRYTRAFFEYHHTSIDHPYLRALSGRNPDAMHILIAYERAIDGGIDCDGAVVRRVACLAVRDGKLDIATFLVDRHWLAFGDHDSGDEVLAAAIEKEQWNFVRKLITARCRPCCRILEKYLGADTIVLAAFLSFHNACAAADDATFELIADLVATVPGEITLQNYMAKQCDQHNDCNPYFPAYASAKPDRIAKVLSLGFDPSLAWNRDLSKCNGAGPHPFVNHWGPRQHYALHTDPPIIGVLEHRCLPWLIVATFDVDRLAEFATLLVRHWPKMASFHVNHSRHEKLTSNGSNTMSIESLQRSPLLLYALLSRCGDPPDAWRRGGLLRNVFEMFVDNRRHLVATYDTVDIWLLLAAFGVRNAVVLRRLLAFSGFMSIEYFLERCASVVFRYPDNQRLQLYWEVGNVVREILPLAPRKTTLLRDNCHRLEARVRPTQPHLDLKPQQSSGAADVAAVDHSGDGHTCSWCHSFTWLDTVAPRPLQEQCRFRIRRLLTDHQRPEQRRLNETLVIQLNRYTTAAQRLSALQRIAKQRF